MLAFVIGGELLNDNKKTASIFIDPRLSKDYVGIIEAVSSKLKNQ